MSLQASAVNQVLRLVRNMMLSSGEPAELREKIHNQCKRMPDPPKEARYEETLIAGTIPAWWVRMPNADEKKVLMYLHGGGYMFGSTMTTHKDLMWRLAKAAQCPVLSVDYRLAPEDPYPAGLDDAFTAYQTLLEHYHPQAIAIGGDSAGGGLTFATLLKIKQQGLPQPSAAFGLSPWTDLAVTGESVVTNLKKDHLIPGDGLKEGTEYYLAGADPTDPLASPLYGDLTGLPPTLLQVGSEEVLLDDSRRLAQKMEASGVPVVLDIWSKLPHVWQVMAMILPEGKVAIDRIGIFLRGHQRSVAKK